jgi:hypothetical protein
VGTAIAFIVGLISATRKTDGKRDPPIISTKKVLLNWNKCCVWNVAEVQNTGKELLDSWQWWPHEDDYFCRFGKYVAFIFKILNWCAMISNKKLLWSVLFCAARSCDDASRGSWLPSGGRFLRLRCTAVAWSCNQKVSVGQHYAGSSATCHFWLNDISCGCLVAALWDVGIVDWIMSDCRWNDAGCVQPSIRPSWGRL